VRVAVAGENKDCIDGHRHGAPREYTGNLSSVVVGRLVRDDENPPLFVPVIVCECASSSMCMCPRASSLGGGIPLTTPLSISVARLQHIQSLKSGTNPTVQKLSQIHFLAVREPPCPPSIAACSCNLMSDNIDVAQHICPITYAILKRARHAYMSVNIYVV